jgi:hypothetical protein
LVQRMKKGSQSDCLHPICVGIAGFEPATFRV